jgi:phospholipase C
MLRLALISLAVCACIARPIDDNIKHIVIFMQENRAFDHYYGYLSGVRGFNDRAATPTRLGGDTFFQPVIPNTVPTSGNGTLAGPYMIPFPVRSTETSGMCMPAPSMDFFVNMGVISNGTYDGWNTARDPGMGMSYFNRTDLPYYYALYDEWMVGDHYFQSTPTETNPNRLHLFSGTNGLNLGHFPILYDEEPAPGWKWETLAETLQSANVSWRVYQELDNFDDNGFQWFELFDKSLPGSVWWDNGMYRSLDFVAEFESDLKSGKLPQVSWLIAPEFQSEHATNHPAAGEDLSAQIIKVISKYPEVYKNMAFILNYDEGGQFYDHLWTPMPPLNQPLDGQSTVTTDGEHFQCQNFPFLVNNSECPESFRGVEVNNGLGYRVPLLVVSPWTRGKSVTSEVFDHTSVVRLIETRFNVTCPNISPWRRAAVGNLATVFDFENPDYSWPTLPDNTWEYPVEADVECLTLPPPIVPAVQEFPTQEVGVRRSKALPYDQNVSFKFFPASLSGPAVVALTATSTGTSSSNFILYNVRDISTVVPMRFLIEPTKTVVANMTLMSETNFSVSLHGVNGYVRKISGVVFPGESEVSWKEFKQNSSCGFQFQYTALPNQHSAKIVVTDNAYEIGGPWIVILNSENPTQALSFDISSSGRWYDFTVERFEGTLPTWSQRFMGRMENGQDSISDPAMSAGIPSGLYGPVNAKSQEHPQLPESVRILKRKEGKAKDSKFHKDEL